MTSKKYFLRTLGIALILAVAWIAYNFIFNAYGLWYSKENCYFYSFERASKFLMAQRYVPEHFDGLLIGPSYSDNMDTSLIKGYKTYNLSINGGNSSELRKLCQTVFDRGHIKLLIICLHPYITQTKGLKTNHFQTTTWRDALFGQLAFQTAWNRLNMLGNEQMRKQYEQSSWGRNNYSKKPEEIEQYASLYTPYLNRQPQIQTKPAIVYTQAVDDLQAIIDESHKQKIRILAYYFPIFQGQFHHDFNSDSWQAYKAHLEPLFTDKVQVIDMNTPAYNHFTRDIHNYTDGHLSEAGADLLSRMLCSELEQQAQRQTTNGSMSQ